MSETFVKDFRPIKIDMHGVRLPEFSVEENKANVDNLTFLTSICYEGYEKRMKLSQLDPSKAEEYAERTKYELETLKDLGFVDYILLVWDVLNYCRKEDIPVGLGRGSAAGSLVLYLIGVTDVDPIKYGLFFERFISKTRAKKKIVDGITYLDGELMCDVDIDVCYYNRGKVLEFLETKFKGKTGKILTLNTLSGKLLMKECGKIVAEKDETEMNVVSSHIPKVFGKVKDIEEAREESEPFDSWCADNLETYNIALRLRNLIKNKGSHPSGILLSYDDIENSCPTELTSDKDIVSSYDMNWVSLYNVKLDILGLRSVSVVDQACKEIGIKVTDIDLEDVFIYQKLQDLKTPHGLFQIEADTNYRVCQKVKPKNLEQLSAVLALGRPGALSFVDQYSNFSNNDVYEAIHPVFDDILSTTGGVCLYQEQMMQMAHKIGFTLDEAEILRRIVGKKKVAEVKKWKKKIVAKVKENNLAPEVSDVLWSVLEDSANYSFNKSHSIAYASLAAATIYLKFKHPKEFFLSLLKMTRHEPDPIKEISKIEKELSYFNIKLLAPHITKSQLDFSIEGDNIRFGLLSIRGISDKSIDRLNNFKNEYANKYEIFQSAKEALLNIGTLCALIQAGALEGFKQSRTKVVYEAQLWNILTEKEKLLCMKYSEGSDYDLVALVKALSEKKDDKGKPLIRESRIQTIKKKCAPYKDIYSQNRKSESFANWYYEKHLLGYTHGRELRDIFKDKRPGLTSIKDIEESNKGRRVEFIGIVEEKPYSGSSKNGNKYCRMLISAETGFMKALIFKDKLEQCKNMNDGLPKEKNIVIVKGTKVDEAVFADLIAVQTNKIYTKLSDLKSDKTA